MGSSQQGLVLLRALVGGVVVMGGLVGVGWLLRSTPGPRNSAPPPYAGVPAGAGSSSLVPPLSVPPVPTFSDVQAPEKTPPVEFVSGPLSEGLVFTTHASELNIYSTGNSFYELQGRVTNNSEFELEELELSVVLLDAAGKPLVTESVHAVPTHEPSARPGDIRPFRSLSQTVAEVERVQVSVLERKQKKAKKEYPPLRELELKMGAALPSGVSLRLYERNTEYNDYGFGSSFFIGGWELENTGTAPLGMLKVRIDQFNEKGEVLASDDSYFVTSDEIPLGPGERAVNGGTYGSKKGFRDYSITVVEARPAKD